MDLAIYVGKNIETTSLMLVARQMQECVGGRVVEKVPDLKGSDTVVNLIVADQPNILAQRRYIGSKRIVSFFAGNFEEFTPSGMAQALLLLDEGVERLLVHSQHTFDEIRAFAMRTFNYPLAKRVLERVHLVWWAIEPFEYGQEKNPYHWMCPFNRINQTEKDIKLHAEVTRQLQLIAATRGRKFQTDFIYGGVSSGLEIDLSCYRMVQQGNRAMFHDFLRPVSGFLCTSRFESFGIFYLELLASGAVGVFADYPWARKLLGDYPLIVPKADLERACHDVLDRADYWRARVKPLVDGYVEKFSFARFTREMKQHLGMP